MVRYMCSVCNHVHNDSTAPERCPNCNTHGYRMKKHGGDTKQRKTIQRQLIFDAVRRLNCHATAEQVYDAVVKKHPAISKATVYRNLNIMTEAGELLRFSSIDGPYRYDHNCHNHYHFICDRCKRAFDLSDYFAELCDKVKESSGYDVTNHNITFGGICTDCKNMEGCATS